MIEIGFIGFLLIFGVPALIIWGIILFVRKVRNDDAEVGGNIYSVQENNDTPIDWEKSDLQAQRQKMPAWLILIIVFVSIIFLFQVIGTLAV